MVSLQKLSWIAVGLCCMAALLQPYVAARTVLWLFMALIVVADALLLIGVAQARREWLDMDEAVQLQERWRRQRERSR
jgi:hypothetical protein